MALRFSFCYIKLPFFHILHVPSALPAEVATLVTEALCMLLAAGWRPLFRLCPAGARCPASFRGLCVSPGPHSVLSNILTPVPASGLPAGAGGNQDAVHAALPAQHLTVFLHIGAVSRSLPVLSLLEFYR